MEYGSLGLLTRMIEEHGSRLVLFARQWCRTPEDVVQEALVKLAGMQPPPAQPVAWLYQVVRNGAIAAARSDKRRARREAAVARDDWFEQASIDSIDAQTVVTALKELPIELREVVVLRLWNAMPFEQIAELSGTSTSTAHRRYYEGLASLRRALNVASTIPGNRIHE